MSLFFLQQKVKIAGAIGTGSAIAVVLVSYVLNAASVDAPRSHRNRLGPIQPPQF